MKTRPRECLGHEDGRVTVPAADIGHVDTDIESIHDAIERGEPLREQTRLHGSNMPALLERLRLTLSDRYAIDREIGHGERHCRR